MGHLKARKHIFPPARALAARYNECRSSQKKEIDGGGRTRAGRIIQPDGLVLCLRSNLDAEMSDNRVSVVSRESAWTFSREGATVRYRTIRRTA